MFMHISETASDYDKERSRILREVIVSRVERNYIEIMLAYGFDLDELFRKARALPGKSADDNPYLVDRRKGKAADIKRRRRRGDLHSIMRGRE